MVTWDRTLEVSYVTSMFFFFSSRRRHTRFKCDWSSDVCSSDLTGPAALFLVGGDPVPSLGSYGRQPEQVAGCLGQPLPAVLADVDADGLGVQEPQAAQRRAAVVTVPSLPGCDGGSATETTWYRAPSW